MAMAGAHRLQAVVRHTEPSLCASVALSGGTSEPVQRLDKVLRYSRSLDVRHTETELGVSVQLTKYGLCTGVALFGDEPEPALRLDKILRYSRSLDVRHTEAELGVSISLFGGKPELFDVLSTRRWGARHEHRHDERQQQNEWQTPLMSHRLIPSPSAPQRGAP